jgi:hypothetical protein
VTAVASVLRVDHGIATSDEANRESEERRRSNEGCDPFPAAPIDEPQADDNENGEHDSFRAEPPHAHDGKPTTGMPPFFRIALCLSNRSAARQNRRVYTFARGPR